MTTSTGPPAADWYPDPGGPPARLRYWDGARWTGWVATDGVVAVAPVQEPRLVATQWRAGADPMGSEPDGDARMELGGSALGVALGAVVWSVALAIGAGVGADLVGLDTDAQLLAAGALGLYVGLVLGCVVVQRQHGTPGRFLQDYGLQRRRGDWWRGLVASLAARGGGMVLAVLLAVSLGDLLDGDEIDQLPTSGDGDPTAGLLITFAFVAVVVAPVVEELFFRGLLLRALEGVVPDWLALLVQGVLFGLAHMTLGAGLVNALVVVPIAFAGLTFGWLAQRYRRLGPVIFGHAWFNVVAVVITLVILAVD